MKKAANFPNFGKYNRRREQNNSDFPADNEIIWEESDDVYKPIIKSISEFTSERNIRYQLGQVYIAEDALYNLTNHLESNINVEQGGILFGNAYREPLYGRIYVEITASVAAPATIGSGSHLEFTSDSWVGIMEQAKAEHPQENIVGWYHSHPNLGVFMSATDMRTQRAFFHHPWCVSIVCDPVREDIGFFLGERAAVMQPIVFIQNNLAVIKSQAATPNVSDNSTVESDNDNAIPWFLEPAFLYILAGIFIIIAVMLLLLQSL
jgi:proteasome lid subunit RPN8/RPN11